MRKKNKKELKLLTKVARNFKEENRERERERDSQSNTKDMNTPHSHDKAALLLQNLQRRRLKDTHAEDFVWGLKGFEEGLRPTTKGQRFRLLEIVSEKKGQVFVGSGIWTQNHLWIEPWGLASELLAGSKTPEGKTQNLKIPEVRHRWWSTNLAALHVLLSILFLSVCLCAGTTEERQSVIFFVFWFWLLPYCPLCLVLSTGEKKLCVAIRMGCCRFLIASFGFLISGVAAQQ